MSQADDTQDERQNWHWRNSMRPIRFFNLDARAAFPFFLLLIFFRPITIFLTILSTFTFVYLEKRGLTFPAAMRSLRVWVNGQNRAAWLKIRHRKFTDFG